MLVGPRQAGKCSAPWNFSRCCACSWTDAAPAKFLLLGSASPGLLRQSSESLAGRIEVIEIGGFALDEAGHEALGALWLRGGYPRSFLAASEVDSRGWRDAFIRLFLERDLPQLGINVPAPAMRRF